MIFYLASIFSSSQCHPVAYVCQLFPNNRRTAEEHANSPLALAVFREKILHLIVVFVQYLVEVRPAKVGGSQKACQR